MCPDWESNPQLFSLQDDTPTKWATPAKENQAQCLKILLYLSWTCFPPDLEGVKVFWSQAFSLSLFYYLSLCLSSSLSSSVRRLFLCSFLTLKISHQSSPVLFPFPTLTTTRYICFFLWTSQCKLIKLISMTPDSPLIHRLDYGQQRCFSSERNEWKPLNSHIHIVPVM